MPDYINTKTGQVITVTSEISGGNWEPVKKSVKKEPDPDPEVKTVAPKTQTRKTNGGRKH